jgi:holliday junction DNA helicase RuvB
MKIKLIPNNVVGYTDFSNEFKNVVGQDSVMQKLRFFLETQTQEESFPSLLFTGSHGLGKTYIAKKLSDNMGRRFVEINCGAIKDEKDFIDNVLLSRVLGNSPCTLFFDESHKLSTEITTILLSLLNPNPKNTNEIYYKNGIIEFDMSLINVIFATTDAHKMFGPLVNRCERIYFESYDSEDLMDMLNLYCDNVKFTCDKEDLTSACRGRGRDTFFLAQKINRVTHKSGVKIFSDKDWESLKNIFEIYPAGLNKQEVELMKIINDSGPISSSNLALMMMLNVDNIESELEVRPRELDFIKSSSRGRCLTDKGIKYLETC